MAKKVLSLGATIGPGNARKPGAVPLVLQDKTAVVSIVMTVRDDADSLSRAIESVFGQSFRDWELVIIDDGSGHDARSVAEGYRCDARVKIVHPDHQDADAAYHLAPRGCTGRVIAYLDGDTEWYPDYLQRVMETFSSDREIALTYCGVSVVDADGVETVTMDPLRAEPVAPDDDFALGVFAHRRELIDQCGGVDLQSLCSNGREMLQRYAAQTVPHAIGYVGARRYAGNSQRAMEIQSDSYAKFLAAGSDAQPLGRRLKVLYVLRDYPQLSQTYVETEIRQMKRWGVEVEIWSANPPVSPYPVEIPVHYGTLADAIAAARPDLLHVHYMNVFLNHASALRRSQLPITVRAHGFEFLPRLAVQLNAEPQIRAIFVFPHQMNGLQGLPKLRPVEAAFDSLFYHPPREPKDRRLVLRTSAALPTKDLELFFRVAKELTQFRFALVVAACRGSGAYFDGLRKLNAASGSHVDLRMNLPHPAVAALMRKAAIYLHTFDPTGPPYGMPISICEAMATGVYVVARKLEPTADYLGPAGKTYDTDAQAAALIAETTFWTDADWQAASRQSVERAFERHADRRALRPIIESWLALFETKLEIA